MNWYKKAQLVKLPENIESEIDRVLNILEKVMSENKVKPNFPIEIYNMKIKNPYNNKEEIIKIFLGNQYMNNENGLMAFDRENRDIYINFSPSLSVKENFDFQLSNLRSALKHELTHYFDKETNKKQRSKKDSHYDKSDVEFRAVLRQLFDVFKEYYTTLNEEERKRFLQWIATKMDFSGIEYEDVDKNIFFQVENTSVKNMLKAYKENNDIEKMNKIRWALYKNLIRLPI